LENVGGLGDINSGNLGSRFGGLRQAEHSSENRGSKAEDKTMDVKFFPIRRKQDSVCVWGIEIIWGHDRSRIGCGIAKEQKGMLFVGLSPHGGLQEDM